MVWLHKDECKFRINTQLPSGKQPQPTWGRITITGTGET